VKSRHYFVKLAGELIIYGKLIIVGLFFLCSVLMPVLAEDRCSKKLDISCTYNPKPHPEDFSLPMPSLTGFGEMQMVFRKVTVLGSEFWGNEERLVRVGDTRGDKPDNVFEGIQQLPISGVFYDRDDGSWFYYLGKYEVTIAQFVTIMGEGDVKKGLDRFYKATGNRKLINKLKKASKKGKLRKLAHPLAWVTWRDFQAFIHHYNMWCYANKRCFSQLPRLSKTNWEARIDKERDPPGFFRLPTELEWEYAVRGGDYALKKEEGGVSIFEKTLPFSKNNLKKYAWVKPQSKNGTTRIGRKTDINRFYDFFGNVQELSSNFFVAEMVQGKVGALSARGGSFQDQAQTIRSSFRREVEIYKPRENREGKIKEIIESRSPTTGIRLAIGSLVSPSPRFTDHIKTEYEHYEKEFRGKTAAGKSTGDALVRGADDLEEASRTIEMLKKRDAELSIELAAIKERAAELPVEERETESLKEAYRTIEVLKTRYTESSRDIHIIEESLSTANKNIQRGIRNVCSYMTEVALFRLTSGAYSYFTSRKYKTFLEKNKEEAAVSTVMKRRIRNVKKKWVEVERLYHEHFSAYIKTLKKLGGYPKDYIDDAVKRLMMIKSGDKRVIEFITLMKQHLDKTTRGVIKVDLWIGQAQKLALRVYTLR
jgi:hypothetical protein